MNLLLRLAYISETFRGALYDIRYRKFIFGWIDVFYPHLDESGNDVNDDDLSANKQYSGTEAWTDDKYAKVNNAIFMNNSQIHKKWNDALQDKLGPR